MTIQTRTIYFCAACCVSLALQGCSVNAKVNANVSTTGKMSAKTKTPVASAAHLHSTATAPVGTRDKVVESSVLIQAPRKSKIGPKGRTRSGGAVGDFIRKTEDQEIRELLKNGKPGNRRIQ